MNIEAKLEISDQTVAADFGVIHIASDGGFEKGYAKGEADGYEKGHKEGLEEGTKQGFEAGVLSVPLYYARTLTDIFYLAVFPENYECVIRLQKSVGCYRAFMNAQNLKSVKLIADNTEGTVDMSQIIRSTTAEVLDLTKYSRKVTNLSYAFLGASKLKSILGALDCTECTNFSLWLNSASNLEDIEFVPGTIKVSISFQWCEKLTDASLNSIIEGLADLTGQTAQTLTLRTGTDARLTEEQKASVTAKNWNLAYAQF